MSILGALLGGTTSKSVISDLSQSISDIASSSVNDCLVTSAQSQALNTTNTGFKFWGNYSAVQTSSVSATCFADSKRELNLQNQIENLIANKSTADGVALLSAFGASNSTASANLHSLVKNNVTMSNIQKNYNKIAQAQSANFSNSGVIIFESASLTQGDKIFAAATLTAVDDAGIFTTIGNKVDQTASATTSNPLDFLANLAGAGIAWMLLIIIGIVAAIVGFFYFTGLTPKEVLYYMGFPVGAPSGEKGG